MCHTVTETRGSALPLARLELPQSHARAGSAITRSQCSPPFKPKPNHRCGNLQKSNLRGALASG